jgi:hypothetical protein
LYIDDFKELLMPNLEEGGSKGMLFEQDVPPPLPFHSAVQAGILGSKAS